jgi:hypothetical protein
MEPRHCYQGFLHYAVSGPPRPQPGRQPRPIVIVATVAPIQSYTLRSYTYEPFGPETALAFGNGVAGVYRYDLDYRYIADFGILFELLVDSGAAFTGANGRHCRHRSVLRHGSIAGYLAPTAASLTKLSLSQPWHATRVNSQGAIAAVFVCRLC